MCNVSFNVSSGVEVTLPDNMTLVSGKITFQKNAELCGQERFYAIFNVTLDDPSLDSFGNIEIDLSAKMSTPVIQHEWFTGGVYDASGSDQNHIWMIVDTSSLLTLAPNRLGGGANNWKDLGSDLIICIDFTVFVT